MAEVFGSRYAFAVPRESEYVLKDKAKKSGRFPRVGHPLSVKLQANLAAFQNNAQLMALLERRRALEEQANYEMQAQENIQVINQNVMPALRTGVAPAAAAARAGLQAAGLDATEYLQAAGRREGFQGVRGLIDQAMATSLDAKPKSSSAVFSKASSPAFSKAASQASTRAPDTAASTLGTIAESGRPTMQRTLIGGVTLTPRVIPPPRRRSTPRPPQSQTLEPFMRPPPQFMG